MFSKHSLLHQHDSKRLWSKHECRKRCGKPTGWELKGLAFICTLPEFVSGVEGEYEGRGKTERSSQKCWGQNGTPQMEVVMCLESYKLDNFWFLFNIWSVFSYSRYRIKEKILLCVCSALDTVAGYLKPGSRCLDMVSWIASSFSLSWFSIRLDDLNVKTQRL